jgi:uncharacterized membrane protein YbaN (DUF454 family)
MTPNQPDAKSLAVWPGRSLRRWLFALLGLVSVGIGFLGVFLPGLPTVVFLIAASYFFTRSCPWLEEKLVRAPIFRPYLRYLDREAEMPLRARIATVVMIWTASAISCLVLQLGGKLETWFVASIAVAATIGSIVVWRMFRGPVGKGDAVTGAEEAETHPVRRRPT